MRVRVTNGELKRLARGERIPIVRIDGREGTVEIFDASWNRVGTGFLTKVGRLRAKKGYVEVNGGRVPVEQLSSSEDWLKRVERVKKHGGTYFVHWLEPVRVRA